MTTVKDAIQSAAIKLRGFAQTMDQHLALFAKLKAGELDAQREAWRPQVEAAIERVTEALRVAHEYPHRNFPTEFWRTDDGKLVADVYAWLYGHEYMRLSEAAAILFDTDDLAYKNNGSIRVHMHHLLHPEGQYTKPRLRLYWQSEDRHPKRVRRSEVLRIKPTIQTKGDRASRKLARQQLALKLVDVDGNTEREAAEKCGVSLTQLQRDLRDARLLARDEDEE